MNIVTATLQGIQRLGLRKDLEYLTHNVGMLLAAGVDVAGALESIETGVKNKKLKNLIRSMRKDLASGEPLSTIFEKCGLFHERIILLIRLGEESGQLVSQFRMISVQEEKQRILRSKLKSALLYPGFVFIVTLVVGVSVSWFILPRLAKVFFQMKLELPLITKVVLSFGVFLGKYGLIAVPIFIILIAILIEVIFVLPRTRWIGQAILFAIPGVRQLIQEIELARLGVLLGGLLHSGVPILPALRSLRSATESDRYKELYSHLYERINVGDSIEQSIASFKTIDTLIPRPIQQLLIVGGKSGNLADMLLKIGAVYEEKSDASSRNLSVILEPILLFIVWLAVVGVALGVILPIYQLIGGIHR